MQQQNLSSKQKKALAALTFESSTMDLLKKIELRMEMLTQELERLPEEKVKIAQRVRIFSFLVIKMIQYSEPKGIGEQYFYANKN